MVRNGIILLLHSLTIIVVCSNIGPLEPTHRHQIIIPIKVDLTKEENTEVERSQSRVERDKLIHCCFKIHGSY
jgi:hypothetical protein